MLCHKALISLTVKKGLYAHGVLSKMASSKITVSNRKSLTVDEVIQGVFADRDSDDAASSSENETETSSFEEVHSDGVDDDVPPKVQQNNNRRRGLRTRGGLSRTSATQKRSQKIKEGRKSLEEK